MVMNAERLKEILFNELGYDKTSLIQRFNPPETGILAKIEEVYKVQELNIAYFCRFEDVDLALFNKLHRAIWNESKTPLLFVICPTEIYVYNCYEIPHPKNEGADVNASLIRHLTDIIDVETARQKIYQELYQQNYDRFHIETGAFWDSDDGRRINKERRADNYLLSQLRILRSELSKLHLRDEFAYAIIGRSIFIRYLQDIKFDIEDSSKYINMLSDKDKTYKFFKKLSEKFGGDLFPILDGEINAVGQDHLNWLQEFLNGNDLVSGQKPFWAYDFRYMPIELISGIYDTFLNDKEKKRTGSYYTPLNLVDLVLEETMPPEETFSEMKILDPACGSGIFLVRAYQRLINAWIREHQSDLSLDILTQILKRSIFGVDINHNAIDIAIFSLYLVILDKLPLNQIKGGKITFPILRNENLFVGDFFSPDIQLSLQNHKFKRIIGNPPWKKGGAKDSIYIQDWLKQAGYENRIGDGQISQVFALAMPNFCDDDGEIALLLPARGTLFFNSTTSKKFLDTLLYDFQVRVVFNLMAFRTSLFATSNFPAVALFYKKSHPTSLDHKIIYVTPKPSLQFKQLGFIIITSKDVKYLSLSEIRNQPNIWKTAFWGTKSDEILIKQLSILPTLEQEMNRLGFHMEEGIEIGKGEKAKKDADWLINIDYIETLNIDSYLLDKSKIIKLDATKFYRPRSKSNVKGPLALIKQNIRRDGSIAAFHETDIAYLHAVIGITGSDSNILKWIVIYINSSLLTYYHFMTSTRFGVERSPVSTDDYKNIPFILPDRNSTEYREALELYAEIEKVLITKGHEKGKAEIQRYKTQIDNIVFTVFGLYEWQRQLIYDTLEYELDSYYWSISKAKNKNGTNKKSVSIDYPTPQAIRNYAKKFVDVVNSLLQYEQMRLIARTYQNDMPLTIVEFEKIPFYNSNYESDVISIEGTYKMKDLLFVLDSLLIEQKTPFLYMQRQIRIYEQQKMYLIRPSENRYWTESQALIDSEEAVAEWLSQSYELFKE